jgi:hypothetical protein
MRDVFYGTRIMDQSKYEAFLQKILKPGYTDINDFIEREAYYIFRIM